ncbi:MAG: hypothetical protein IT204_11885 [Fimbriimonadaceae bacterium]|nr:hypothetical protein [Fimbriimonadaceae bacterium]
MTPTWQPRWFDQDQRFKPVWTWLRGPHGRLVFGGRLATELLRVKQAAQMLQELKRAGKAHLADAAQVDEATEAVRAACSSDDPHVVALAQVTGARLLCSDDKLLIDDFKNGALLRPVGKVYRGPEHSSLLEGRQKGHSSGCPGSPAATVRRQPRPR